MDYSTTVLNSFGDLLNPLLMFYKESVESFSFNALDELVCHIFCNSAACGVRLQLCVG